MRILRCVLGAILTATLSASAMAQEEAAPAGAGKDTVKLKSSQQILAANVTDETYESVKINGEPKPTAEIEEIRHGDQPSDFVIAESNFKQFQLENAIKNFQKAKAAQARPWLKHYCDYYIGKCYEAMSEAAANAQERQTLAAKAVQSFDALIKESPKGYWVPNTMFSLGHCYFSMRNFPKALAAYQAIEKANMGPAWTLKAQLWAGKILTEQNQLEAASQALEKVAAAAKEKYADIYNEAQIALAESYIKANKPEKFKAAEDLLKKIIETNDRDEVLAVAHNTLGDCYKAQNKVKEARLEYLRTNVLYFKAKEQDARALFSAAECCESLKEKDRADQLREELKKTYPDSQWARAL